MHSKGYKDVVGKEALHKETYKIFAKNYNVVDISYVPNNIYSNIPYIEKDNIRYTHPSFTMIDLMRMITEPFFSSWRWAKIVKRIHLLQKYYPFQKINNNPISKKHIKVKWIKSLDFTFER